ncbi:uncharacterized protein SETTUDRAFT_27884 [Exserohilum turcica Et28A]|uniref:Uncharacterized protein n=1 Tax=Exserohilum turcicum (strain 28A) TaxID=671987 RepID=R0K4D3_EXST2|nr:uncharacterized protein SETTUDRAFT_27884 [Exserohilum turcica Et28A]EOA87948.1 hypothetical protein SETTUDRAFT_27884 [Exserohilum turcica Et28A]
MSYPSYDNASLDQHRRTPEPGSSSTPSTVTLNSSSLLPTPSTFSLYTCSASSPPSTHSAPLSHSHKTLRRILPHEYELAYARLNGSDDVHVLGHSCAGGKGKGKMMVVGDEVHADGTQSEVLQWRGAGAHSVLGSHAMNYTGSRKMWSHDVV